jgi:chromosome segregation ATPase
MKALWRLGALGVVAMLVIGATGVRAQYARPGSPGQPSQAPVSPLAAQRKAVQDAAVAVNQIKSQIALIRGKVSATFETKDDWVAAKKALADAQAHYDAALKPVMAALQANPDYLKLQAHRKAAQENLDAMRSQPRPSDSSDQKAQDDQLSQAAGDVLTDGFAMNKMEVDARNSDGDLGTAKEELTDAKKTMEDLQGQVTAVLQTDPDYQAAQQQLTAAEQQLAAARLALANAEKPQRTTPSAPNRNPSRAQ